MVEMGASIRRTVFGTITANTDHNIPMKAHVIPTLANPPVIVDEEGKYYGRLTLNIYHSELGMGSKLRGWLNQEVCAQ
jgi:hypothetical protein